MKRLIVTGTGTGVGKTVVAAAVAALAPGSCAYVKPVQTGVPGDVPDADTVARLSGVRTYELSRFAPPLSPEAAARHEGRPPPDVDELTCSIAMLKAELVLVEGAGGLLVRFDERGTTVATIAQRLGAAAVVVTAAGLGALNATALTLEALRAREIPLAGLVIGSWPAAPGLAERSNIADLEEIAGAPLAGVVPSGAGALPRGEFKAMASRSLAPALGGRFEGVVG